MLVQFGQNFVEAIINHNATSIVLLSNFKIFMNEYLTVLWYVKVNCFREGQSWKQLKDQWRIVQMVILSKESRSLS